MVEKFSMLLMAVNWNSLKELILKVFFNSLFLFNFRNDYKKNIVLLLCVVLLVITAWVPWILFPVSIILLLLASKLKPKDAKLILVTVFPFLSVAITLIQLFEPSLRYYQSDFIGYYNNYLFFLDLNGLQNTLSNFWNGFIFGGGIEIGLPILNFLFSAIIQEPAPYVFKLFHLLLLQALLINLLFLISKKLSLNIHEFIILICFIYVFIKFGSLFNHLRQTYSSFFILLALFSSRKMIALLLLFTAICFHLSAIFIYPLTRWLMFSRKSYNKYLVISIIISFVLLSILPLIFDLMLASNIGDRMLNRVLWFFYRAQEAESLAAYFEAFVLRIAYFIPILIFSVLLKRTYTDGFKISLFIFLFIFAFWYLPGLPLRIFEVFILLLPGYLYFLCLKRTELKTIIPYLVLIPFVLIHSITWMTSDFYFYEFTYSAKPFNYIDLLFQEYRYIDRDGLPSINEINGE